MSKFTRWCQHTRSSFQNVERVTKKTKLVRKRLRRSFTSTKQHAIVADIAVTDNRGISGVFMGVVFFRKNRKHSFGSFFQGNPGHQR